MPPNKEQDLADMQVHRLHGLVTVLPQALDLGLDHARLNIKAFQASVRQLVHKRKCEVKFVEQSPVFNEVVQKIKNEVFALRTMPDATQLVVKYFQHCLPTAEQFVDQVMGPPSERPVKTYNHLPPAEAQAVLREACRKVAEAPQDLPPHLAPQIQSHQAGPPFVPNTLQWQPQDQQTAFSYQLQQGYPQPVAPAPRRYPIAMPQRVNTGYGYQHFQNHATTHGNPAGYGYNGSSSGVNPSASLAPAFSTGQQYQLPPATGSQHLSHAHPTPASSAAAASPNFMDREMQQLLYSDLPLVQACQRLIYAADTAGITKPEEKEWFEKIRAAERHVPQAERWRLVDFLEVGASTINKIVDDCINGHLRSELVHGLAQEAMKRCSEEIERLAHFHAGETGQTLRSLGSSFPSSHSSNRLSHRQRAIYGRTFSSSAY